MKYKIIGKYIGNGSILLVMYKTCFGYYKVLACDRTHSESYQVYNNNIFNANVIATGRSYNKNTAVRKAIQKLKKNLISDVHGNYNDY